ncbi:MAG: RibD family protein, partial [Rhodothermales bacterium]
KTGRPLVSLKLAQTLDGRIATLNGDSQWVSGEAARTLVHEWRAQLDAVLVGYGTALSDNPSLTVRHVAGRHPYRVVLDRAGKLPLHLNLFSDEFVGKTIAVVSTSAKPVYANQLTEAGGQLLRLPEKDGHLDLTEVLTELGKSTDSRKGFQSVLVEAGPSLATAFFEQDLVDQLNLFIAPKLIGQGLPTLNGLSIEKMSQAKTFAKTTWTQVGEDMLFRGLKESR